MMRDLVGQRLETPSKTGARRGAGWRGGKGRGSGKTGRAPHLELEIGRRRGALEDRLRKLLEGT